MDDTFCFYVFLAFVIGVVHCSTAEDVVTNAELLSRIQALETEGRWMKQFIMTQKTELNDLRTVVETQLITLEKQDQTIKDLQEWKQRQNGEDDSPKEDGSAEDTTIERKNERTKNRISNNGKWMKKIIIEQKEELNDLRTVVKVQQNTLEKQDKTIKDLQEWKQRQTDKTEFSKQDRSQDLTTSKQDIDNTERRENELKMERRMVLDSDGSVAFHAVIMTNKVPTLGDHQKIVFDVVRLNLGSGYHNLHGLFIAPAQGIYIFSVSIISNTHNNDKLDVGIMMNGVLLAAAYAHGSSLPWDQGSVTVVTQLAVGDEVWVEHITSVPQSIDGNAYSSFMGCLVVPL